MTCVFFIESLQRALQEIAILTGGKAITEGLDIELKNIQISDLGQAKKITAIRRFFDLGR